MNNKWLFTHFIALLLSAQLTIFFSLSGDLNENRILYLAHCGELNHAITLYQQSAPPHNHDILEQLCQIILEQGFKDDNPENHLMSLFGAGISANERLIYLIERALRSPVPQIQLTALNMIIRSQHSQMEETLRFALRSPFLLIRLEALFHLAESKNPKIAGYTESLMAIVPSDLLPIFPEIFSEAGDEASTRMLKRLLSHSDENVRIATLLSIAKHQRDDFLPKIRTLATHSSPRQLEACAFALGKLKDSLSIPRLQQLASAPQPNVQLAASLALYRLGQKERGKSIEEMANSENLFAISALSEIANTEETLRKLQLSQNPHVRVNATLALVEKKDPQCIKGLPEILLKDSRDYGFTKSLSKGLSSSAWKVTPSAEHHFKESPGSEEQSLQLKEAILTKALELDEAHFLQIANSILSSHQTELIPLLISLLENKQTESCMALLKTYQQKAGAPLLRQYCNLALFRLGEQGPYIDLVKDWVLANRQTCLFHFKPLAKLEEYEAGSFCQLTPDQTSKLLIESIETLAKNQNDYSIDFLLEVIKDGNLSNKYVVAGLLLRIIQ